MSLPDFPRKIQIQTTVACGAACSICPHPVESPNWSNKAMPDELFERVATELARHEVEYISPYLMADPLSDKKIFDRMRRLRELMPGVTLEISTTGKYLPPPLADKLLDAPLTELRISSHGLTAEEYAQTMPGVPHAKAMANILAFVERWKQTRPYKLSIVCLWGLWSRQREAEIEAYWNGLGIEVSKWRVITRASQVDLRIFGQGSPDPTLWSTGRREPPYLCRHHRDTEWMHILSDGRVTLCCMDYKQSHVLGSLADSTLEEIWRGEAYQRVRRQIRGELPMDDSFLCRGCEWHVSQSVYEAQTRANAAARQAAVVAAKPAA